MNAFHWEENFPKTLLIFAQISIFSDSRELDCSFRDAESKKNIPQTTTGRLGTDWADIGGCIHTGPLALLCFNNNYFPRNWRLRWERQRLKVMRGSEKQRPCGQFSRSITRRPDISMICFIGGRLYQESCTSFVSRQDNIFCSNRKTFLKTRNVFHLSFEVN